MVNNTLTTHNLAKGEHGLDRPTVLKLDGSGGNEDNRGDLTAYLLGSETGAIPKTPREKPDAVIPPKMENSPDSSLVHMTMAVSLQSLLVQFSHPRVRGDFLTGKFGCNINPELLIKLDDLRWTLLPRWKKGDFLSIKARSEGAAVHITKLLEQSMDHFVLSEDEKHPLTYAEWYSTLEAIAADRYWDRVPYYERCVHILSSTVKESTIDLGESMKERSPVKSTKTEPPKIKRKRSAKREVISSGSSSSSDSVVLLSSDSSSEATSSGSSSPVQHRSRRSHRKLVKPQVYEIDGQISISEFLSSFERYFSSTYEGTSQDKTHVLSQFLSGDILRVYKVRGGRKLRYSDMKRELINYCKGKKNGGKSHFREQLANATPESDESLEIYGLRLMELMERAYPKDKKEGALQVRKRFLSTIPDFIYSKVSDAERALKITTNGRRKYLKLKALFRMADELQEECNEKAIMWIRQPRHYETEVTAPTFQRQAENRARRVPIIHQARTFSRSYHSQSHNNEMRCSFCHIPNHTRENCRREQGLCLICGGTHLMENCPQYDVNYRTRSKSRQRRQQSVDRPLNL